ncbi:MAG: divalent cation transporter [Pseudomonadota bacterium]
MILGLLAALLAGAMIPLGAYLASIEHIRPVRRREEVRHGVMAFAGGALISAVALVLVPEGTERLSTLAALLSFAVGGVLFAAIDAAIARSGESRGQMVAMLADFLPEAVALGALLTTGSEGALLMAAIIGLQNLPEGYNAYHEVAPKTPGDRRRLLIGYSGIACLGLLAALLGVTVFAASATALGVLMMVAAGGILYLVFQDVAPKVAMEKSWAPPLGAVLGFGLGLLGHLLVA